MTEELQATSPAEQSPVVEQQDTFDSPTPPEPESKPTEPVFRSRRDALEKAFKDVDGDTPPEGEEAPTGERARGPDGKFVAKEATEAKPEGEKAPETPEAPVKQSVSAAPTRFSPDAKAEWEKAPESVRGEINRAITELETGLQQKSQQLEPLKPYFEMAKQHGVTVHETLDRYIRMEQALANDPRQGMELLARNFGMTLPDFIAKVSGQQPQGQEGDKDRQILAMQREIEALKGEFGNVSKTLQEQKQTGIMQAVQMFAADNPRFEELAPEIQRLLETGYADSLEKAYELADRLNPAAPIAAPAATTPAPAQTRQPLSVTGAPGAGSNPANRQPSKSLNESLSRAFGAAGLA